MAVGHRRASLAQHDVGGPRLCEGQTRREHQQRHQPPRAVAARPTSISL
jgi:hypothetical protein